MVAENLTQRSALLSVATDSIIYVINDPAGTPAGGKIDFATVLSDLNVALDGETLHNNVAGEIAALTEKTVPVGADHLVMNDSAAANAIVRVTLANALTSSGVSTNLATKFSTDTKSAPADDDFLMCADPDNVSDALKTYGVSFANLYTNEIKPKADLDFHPLTTNLVRSSVTAVFTAGYTHTSVVGGDIDTGAIAPTFATRQFHHYGNTGATGLTAPSGVGSMVVEIENKASAGLIVPTGFDKQTGDAFTQTLGHFFHCVINNSNAKKVLHVTQMT